MSSAIFERSSVPPTRLVPSQWWDRLAAFSRRAERNRNPITNQSVVVAENVKETFVRRREGAIQTTLQWLVSRLNRGKMPTKKRTTD
jgi:hypothetical protein